MQTQPREVQSSEDDQLPGQRTQSGERGCRDDCNPWVGTRREGDSLVPEKVPARYLARPSTGHMSGKVLRGPVDSSSQGTEISEVKQC